MAILYRRTLTVAECLDRFVPDEAKREYQRVIDRLNRTTDRDIDQAVRKNSLTSLPSPFA